MVAAWLENDSAELCGAEQDTAMGGRGRRPRSRPGGGERPEVSGDTEGQGRQTAARRREQAGEGETGGMIAGHLDPKTWRA